MKTLVGACGKHTNGMCFPDFADDLCASCPYFAWPDLEDTRPAETVGNGEQEMKVIRFKLDCQTWMRQGKKTTTFRKNKKNGVHEIIEGDWYHPKHLGMFVKLTPLFQCPYTFVLYNHYRTEGDFESADQFEEWLRKVGLWKTFASLSTPPGWLMQVEYLGEKPE